MMKTASYSKVVLLLALTGPRCPAEAVLPALQETKPGAPSKSDLAEIPQPELSQVDEPVRNQIQAAQTELSATLARTDSTPSQKATSFGNLAEIYQAYGFDDSALVGYENAAKLEPQSFRWPYYAGYLRQRSGDTDSALRDYRRAQALKPSDKCVLLRLGNLEFSANHLDAAKSWFAKSMPQRNPSAAAMAGLGKIALSEHDYPAALKYFKEALALEPRASSIHYQLAMTYRGLGEMAKMQEQLQARGDVEPTIKDPLMDEINLLRAGKVGLLERATKAVQENRFADAIATYRQMVHLYPSDPIAHMYLGVVLAKAGRHSEALQQYTQTLQLDPNNAPVHYNIGTLLIDGGKLETAIPHFRQAIQLDPGFAPAHFQLANLLMRARHDEEAGQEYGIVTSLEPKNGFARLMQAMASVHAGAYAQARSLLEQGLLALPEDPDIANALARVLAAAPDPAVRDESRGLQLIETLVRNQQGNAFEDGVTLAMALAAVGRFRQAASYQQALIDQLEKSGKPDLVRHLGKNLELYEHGQPCRTPWAKDDPIFTPVPSKSQISAEMKRMTANP